MQRGLMRDVRPDSVRNSREMLTRESGISLAPSIHVNLRGSPKCPERRGLLPRLGAIRFAVAALWLITPAGIPAAEACVCDANPPCAATWSADAVFVGTVVNDVWEPLGGSLTWLVHNVAVTQTLRRSVGPSAALETGDQPTPERLAAAISSGAGGWGTSDCGYRFQIGGRYLIYARRTADGRWTTSRCSGTKRIDEAGADLDYFASLTTAEPIGHLYGNIERYVVDPSDPAKSRRIPAAGVAVAVTSESNRLMVRTDVEGKLDIRVPPGEYTIAPVVSDIVRMYGAPMKLQLAARGCATVYFSLFSNGRIEGRVVRENGTPVSRAPVDVIPADLPLDSRLVDSMRAPEAFLDENGRFSIDGILPGRYVMGVNARLGPRLDSPYAITYFPGVPRQNASVIEISEGERKSGVTIVVKPLLETTISGVVVFAHGRPVTKAMVTATPVNPAGMSIASSTADTSGAFQLRVLSGLTYVINALTDTNNGLRQAETTVFVDQQTEGIRLSIRR